jgi:hypothetical protein
MKLMWLGYLVYSLNNCTMKLYIETGLRLSTIVTLNTCPLSNTTNKIPYLVLIFSNNNT